LRGLAVFLLGLALLGRGLIGLVASRLL